MSDEPIAPDPSPDPDAAPNAPSPPSSAPPAPTPPARVAMAVRTVALGAIVFVATLLLLLGATRLLERGGAAPGPTPSPSVAAEASASARPSSSPDQGTGSSAAPGVSAAASPGASPTGDPVLVGAGDIGVCSSSGDEDTAALLDGIEGTVFTAGDNAYENGTAAQFRDCYDSSWGRHRARTRPAPGNHDWDTSGLAGYLEYFGEAAQGPDDSSWYSYDLGTWHVIILDSNCGKVDGCDPSSAQGEWLAGDLAATNARCTVAIFHHPRFSSGEHGDLPAMDAFWRPLYAAGVDVIVNGHDHDYERFAPQDPDGRADPERGIREFVVGTGGAPLRRFVRTADTSELRVSIAHGVLAFTLHDGSYDWSFIAAGNDFRDGGTAPCH